jgi:hypothetical protein
VLPVADVARAWLIQDLESSFIRWTLTANIRLERLIRDKQWFILPRVTNDIDTRGLYHKTYYGRNIESYCVS